MKTAVATSTPVKEAYDWLVEIGFSSLEVPIILGLGRRALQHYMLNASVQLSKDLTEKTNYLLAIRDFCSEQFSSGQERDSFLNRYIHSIGETPMTLIHSGNTYHLKAMYLYIQKNLHNKSGKAEW